MSLPRLALSALLAVAALAQAAPQGQGQKRRPPEFTPPEDLVLEKDVPYGRVGDRELKLDILRPKAAAAGPMPAVIWFHGGGFRSGNKEKDLPKLVPLARKGFLCASVAYRLSGEAPFPAQIEDCKCAVRFLRAKAKGYHVDPERIGAWGFSAGGGLAALVGTSGDVAELEGTGGWQDQSSRVQAACCWAGIFDFPTLGDAVRGHEDVLEAYLGGKLADRKEAAVRASPTTYVTKDDPPFLIARGDKDPKSPEQQSVDFVEALKKAGVDATLHRIPGAGHGGPGFEKEIDEAAAFFTTQLAKKP